MKRVFLFLGVNILVLLTISLVINLLGIQPYLSANGINYESLLIFCLLWGMGGSLISLQLSKWMAKFMMKVEVLDPRGTHGALVQKVHLLAKRAGIEKMPEVGIYHSPEVNAFATGPSKNNSLVAVSTGLLERMNEEEVDGVLGHEIAHIANGDMVTMALVQGVINAFVMFLSRVVAFAINNMMKDEEGRGGLGGFAYMGVVWGLDLLFGLMAMPLVAWFSRYREYRADAGGAQFAGKAKMISALEALKGTLDKVDNSEPNYRTMKISNRGGLMQWLSTHPSLDDRIKALQRSQYT